MWSGVNNFHSDLWLYDFPPWEALKKGQRRISLSQLHEVRSIFLWWNLWLVGPLGKKGSFWMLEALYFHLKKDIWCVWHFAFFVKIILKELFNCNTSHIQFVSLSFTHDKGHLAAWSSRGSPGFPLFFGCDLRGARPFAMWPPKKESVVSAILSHLTGYFWDGPVAQDFSQALWTSNLRCRGMSCWQMWLPAKDLRLRAPRCPGWLLVEMGGVRVT